MQLSKKKQLQIEKPEALKSGFRIENVMTDIETLVLALWQDCSNLITQRFGLESDTVLNSVEVIEAHETARIGGYYVPSSKKIRIHLTALQGLIPLEGVVYRECLINNLPPELCIEAKYDLASEFARQTLKKNDRLKWVKEWQTIPTRRIRGDLIHTSYKAMEWLISLGGAGELDSLVHEFVSLARYGKSFDFEEYVKYLNLRTRNIVVELTHADVKIVDVLLKDASASYNQVAKITGLSPSWVSTRINRLKRKYVLMNFISAPFSRIGIRTFYILLAGPSWSDPSKLLDGCPYLYDVRSILNGPWQLIARFAVPDSTETLRSLDQMSSILNRNGIAVDVAETYSVGISNSFYHYNPANRKWEIPWVAMRGWGHRITDESLFELVERIDFPTKTTDVYLDELDMSIITLIQNGVTSTRAVRKKLSIGQTKLTTHLRKLRAEGLIRSIWSVQNIGLVERVAIRATDRRTADILDAWSRELPRAYMRYEENRNLLLMTDLPVGGSMQLMDTLRSLKWPVTVSPLSSGTWGHWKVPYNLWDVERQGWQAPRDEIASWLSMLVEESENLTVETSSS
ncbi:MAG: winged helix-turn-helix transcriptional regulator [Candidatus Thorarchaeota archaeon]